MKKPGTWPGEAGPASVEADSDMLLPIGRGRVVSWLFRVDDRDVGDARAPDDTRME